MEEVSQAVANLGEKLAEVFQNRQNETRAYLKTPEYWIRESRGSVTFLAAELSRIYFRQAVDAEPRAKTDFWLKKAGDREALGLQDK